jgi:hypothetical protein
MKLPRILLVFALAAPALAWGQAVDEPERIARLSYVEGDATFQAADGRATRRLPDRPLAHGDRIDTERDSRAEIALGNSVIRLDEQSQLEIVDLDASATRFQLTQGSANVILDELLEDETFEILTPNTAIALEQPGEYRVDVFAADRAALSVHGGSATVESAAGPIRVVAGQRVQLDGRNAFARLVTPPPADAFDDWVLEREMKLAEAESPRYTPYEGERYADLDRYGEWYDDPYYGRVWMPGYGYSGWSPYDGGYWQRAGLGWSWFDPMPWGYYTYYGGRWTYLRDRDRWCWVPTRVRPRHFDDDSHPYGWPRRHRPDRAVPESAPRTADRQPPAVDERPRVATPTLAPRRVDPERRPAQLPEYSAGERQRGRPASGGEPVARGEPASRGGSSERAPAAAPPREAAPPAQPARPARADPPRSEPRSERPQVRQETGERHEP